MLGSRFDVWMIGMNSTELMHVDYMNDMDMTMLYRSEQRYIRYDFTLPNTSKAVQSFRAHLFPIIYPAPFYRLASRFPSICGWPKKSNHQCCLPCFNIVHP